MIINNTVSDVNLSDTPNKNSIMNYAGDEVLVIDDADADTIFSYGDSVTIEASTGDVIKFSSGTITATDYKGKAITTTDASNKTSTKTYTTGVAYGSNGIRSSNALWFTEDDNNFIGNNSQLDAFSTADYSVTDVETAANASDLTQQNDSLNATLTFAK